MKKVCLYFQVHQPHRIKPYSFFDLGHEHDYFDDVLNKEVIEKVSSKCYLPANSLFYDLINRHPGFKLAFSFSGVFLDQLTKWSPKVLKSFQNLVDTGKIEVLGETYYHSLASVYSAEEFITQVKKHRDRVSQVFGVTPKSFRNTELIFNQRLCSSVDDLGFSTLLMEGVKELIGKNHPNQYFKTANCSGLKLLARNYKRTDDIAFRFSNKKWKHYPLSPDQYLKWLKEEPGDQVNLFMDYETVGEHHWEETGIFEFWSRLVRLIDESDEFEFVLPQDTSTEIAVKNIIESGASHSWADTERDLSAWEGNYMQREALNRIFDLRPKVMQSEDEELIETWCKLLTSDHFYYMSTKHLNDGAVHSYFSPFRTPHDGYIYYMNVLSDFELRLSLF